MTITLTSKTAFALFVSSAALLFALGASSQNESDGARWAISAVSGDNPGAYVMDQRSGDIYFVRQNPNIGGRDLKAMRLGNISEAR